MCPSVFSPSTEARPLCTADRSAVQQEEDPPAADKPKAMRLEYIQHPQDETSDAAVHFVLAPSYVTYNASTILHVQEFFRTEEVCLRAERITPVCAHQMARSCKLQPLAKQGRSRECAHSTSSVIDSGYSWLQVMDFSALGAQAIAQVERAQRAARDQLVAAMNQRPKLSLKLDLEGPKIAVPVPAADGQGKVPSARCMHLLIQFTFACYQFCAANVAKVEKPSALQLSASAGFAES